MGAVEMIFRITSDLADKYPDINIGCLILRCLGEEPDKVKVDLLRKEAETHIMNSGYTTSTISRQPSINAWRKMYSSFGAKPSKYKCSTEALLRRVLKGDNLPEIHPIVDLYNAISVMHYVPIGAFDLDKVDDFIELRFSRPDDVFRPLGSSSYDTPKPGEVVYGDSKEVLCRMWNYRDAEKTKVKRGKLNHPVEKRSQ